VHNESGEWLFLDRFKTRRLTTFPVNIHSHLWGAALFAYFLTTYGDTYLKQYEATTWVDSAVFAVFLSSAIFCLSASALFHTATCHSEEVTLSYQCYEPSVNPVPRLALVATLSTTRA
jgi:predicted membrane channel-forming protein YqfA (hemolysin III family)